MNTQKGVIHFLPLLLLAIGLIAGVYVMTSRSPLKIFPKAGGAPILFKSTDGTPLSLNSQGVAQASSPTVDVELSSPLGLPGSGTVSYRSAFNPADLQKTEFTSYSEVPTTITVEFPNRPGIQFYWVEFKGANGKIDRRSAKIEVVKVTSIPTPQPTCIPLPTPPDCADDDPPCQFMPPDPDGNWCPSSSPIPVPSSTCKPRPTCLDETPRCLVPEPAEGWCPTSGPSAAPGGICTQDVKQCPDGSYVSRRGPNCEFAPCPGQ